MAQLTMSRRNFMKTMAITGAAAAVSSSAVAPMRALAEDANATAGELKHVRTCCRACGKVECGVWVTVQDGKAIKVEGDESAPQSRGHCCAKSQSSMHAAYHPDRLRYPVKRTNPKGSDDPGWVRITLDEAFELSGQGLGEVVDKYGGQSIFVMCGTSRVWSLGPYQGMKQLFGTPNAHLAYQVCKGPRHWAGIMTDEMGSPWMEVEAEPKVYLQWGTAVEYSNYDTTNRTISDVAPARDGAHLRRSARDAAFQGSRHLAAAAPRHRRRAWRSAGSLDHRRTRPTTTPWCAAGLTLRSSSATTSPGRPRAGLWRATAASTCARSSLPRLTSSRAASTSASWCGTRTTTA